MECNSFVTVRDIPGISDGFAANCPQLSCDRFRQWRVGRTVAAQMPERSRKLEAHPALWNARRRSPKISAKTQPSSFGQQPHRQ
jgi:hypothetical protein